MSKSATIIIQARMQSTRLPGKVLRDILGQPLFFYLIERLKRVEGANRLVVATTTAEADREIISLCQEQGIEWFRGSEEDVLGRFAGAAAEFEAETVVRITADCPLIDPALIDRVIGFYQTNDFDYVSNVVQRTYPRGMDVEVFSAKALYEAADEAPEVHEREHVTPFLYEHPERFRIGSVTQELDQSKYRLTLDTAEDLELIKRLLETIYPTKPKFTLEDLITILEVNPGWTDINAHVKQRGNKK